MAGADGPFVTGGDDWGFQVTPDSTRVVYLADQETDEVYELYVADRGNLMVQFSTGAVSVAENAGSVAIAVTLSSPPVVTTSVSYGVAGGAAATVAAVVFQAAFQDRCCSSRSVDDGQCPDRFHTNSA